MTTTRTALVAFVLSLSFALACADDPDEQHGNYGPCDNMCDNACLQGAIGGEDADVCTVGECGDDEDCPLAFDAVPGLCTVQDGGGGVCVLPCETDAECPIHMRCAERMSAESVCMWRR